VLEHDRPIHFRQQAIGKSRQHIRIRMIQRSMIRRRRDLQPLPHDFWNILHNSKLMWRRPSSEGEAKLPNP
jgi:hypothetical protein